MPTVNPQTFFRFAADHHALLTELYYKREGLVEAELLALIRRHADVQSPSAVYMRDRLVELGILEHLPQATAQFEMTRPVASVVGYLLQEGTGTTSRVSVSLRNRESQVSRFEVALGAWKRHTGRSEYDSGVLASLRGPRYYAAGADKVRGVGMDLACRDVSIRRSKVQQRVFCETGALRSSQKKEESQWDLTVRKLQST